MNEKQTAPKKHQEKHGVANMAMMEKGHKYTVAPLVHSDLPTTGSRGITSMSAAVDVGRNAIA